MSVWQPLSLSGHFTNLDDDVDDDDDEGVGDVKQKPRLDGFNAGWSVQFRK